MATNVKVCEIEASLKEKIKKFRFRKETNNAAILMKVDKEKQLVVLDEEFEDLSLEELQDEVPSSQPRFLLYSFEYEHDDGRKSYPLCFIYITPAGCKPEQQMMYAGSLKALVADAGLTKIFELRNLDDMTEDWLKEKLQYFR